MRVVPATPQGIEETAAAIRAGQVVAYPTETVYGLGVDPFSEAAVERLFDVKSRERGNPVLLIVADDEQLRTVVAHVSAAAAACAQAFCPSCFRSRSAWRRPSPQVTTRCVCGARRVPRPRPCAGPRAAPLPPRPRTSRARRRRGRPRKSISPASRCVWTAARCSRGRLPRCLTRTRVWYCARERLQRRNCGLRARSPDFIGPWPCERRREARGPVSWHVGGRDEDRGGQ